MSRPVGSFMLLLCALSFAPAAVFAAGKAADAMCPPVDATHTYNTAYKYPSTYVENKVEIESLWRKPCSDSYVRAFCTAADFCDGGQLYSQCFVNGAWKPCTLATQQLRQNQAALSPQNNQLGQTKTTTSQGTTPASQGSILFSATPIGTVSGLLSPSGANVSDQIRQDAGLPPDASAPNLGASPDSSQLFSKTPTAENNFYQLAPPTTPDQNATPVQTVSAPGTAVPAGGFQPPSDNSPTNQQLVDQASVFKQGYNGPCDMICQAQVSFGYPPSSQQPDTGQGSTARETTLSRYNGAQCAWGPCPTTAGFANKTLPEGTMVKVTNLDNGKSIVAPVVDRGPYVSGRELDANPAAANALGLSQAQGIVRVSYEVVSGGAPASVPTNTLTVDNGHDPFASTPLSADAYFDTALQNGSLPYSGGGIAEINAPLTYSGASGADESGFVLNADQIALNNAYNNFGSGWEGSAAVSSNQNNELALNNQSGPPESGTNLADQSFLAGNGVTASQDLSTLAADEANRTAENTSLIQTGPARQTGGTAENTPLPPEKPTITATVPLPPEKPAIAATAPSTAQIEAPPADLARNSYQLGDQVNNGSVKNIQEFLNSHGYTVAQSGPGSAGNETDTYGGQTYRAVMAFQKDNGLAADGSVGPQTIAKMNAIIASTPPAPAATAETPAAPAAPAVGYDLYGEQASAQSSNNLQIAEAAFQNYNSQLQGGWVPDLYGEQTGPNVTNNLDASQQAFEQQNNATPNQQTEATAPSQEQPQPESPPLPQPRPRITASASPSTFSALSKIVNQPGITQQDAETALRIFAQAKNVPANVRAQIGMYSSLPTWMIVNAFNSSASVRAQVRSAVSRLR